MVSRKIARVRFAVVGVIVLASSGWFGYRELGQSPNTGESPKLQVHPAAPSPSLLTSHVVAVSAPLSSAASKTIDSRSAPATAHRDSLRNAHLGQIEPLPGNLLEQIPDLEKKAREGDAKAAVDLWYGLDRCRQVFSAAEAEYLKSGAAPNPKEYAKVKNATFESCKGITNEQIDGRFVWLKRAAAGGDAQAQFLYAYAGTTALGGVNDALRDPQAWDEYSQTSMTYLNALAQRCDPYTISFMWWGYKHGNEFFAPDPAKALFYIEISQLQGPSENTPAILAAFQQGLPPSVINSETQAAAQFVQSNCQ